MPIDSLDLATENSLAKDGTQHNNSSLFELAFQDEKHQYERPGPLMAGEFTSNAQKYFNEIDDDKSGTLSKLELRTAAKTGDHDQREVASILYDNFDEAREMATEKTPFWCSDWSLNFVGSNYYRSRFSDDRNADISLKDVNALGATLRHGLYEQPKLREMETNAGMKAGAAAFFALLGSVVAPPGLKPALWGSGAASLLLFARTARNSSTSPIDKQVESRREKIERWVAESNDEMHSKKAKQQR